MTTMMTMIYLFALHFLADFILQSREMGRNKSSDNTYLIKHVQIIMLVFLVGLAPFAGFWLALKFAVLNGLIHGLIDKYIWNIYAWSVWKRNKDTPKESLKANWKYWEDKWFYTTIGFDQFLHMSTIIFVLWVM